MEQSNIYFDNFLDDAGQLGAVGEAVVEAVGEAVDEAVVEAVGEAMVEAVGEAVVDAVGEAVVDAVGEAVVDAVGEAVVAAVVEPNHDIYHEAPRDLVNWSEFISRFDRQDSKYDKILEVTERNSITTDKLATAIGQVFLRVVEHDKKLIEHDKKIDEHDEKIDESQKKIDESQKKIDENKRKIDEIQVSIEDLKRGVSERGAQVQNTVEHTARVAQQVAVAVHENGQSPKARLILELIMRYGMDTRNGYVVGFPIVDGGNTYYVVCLTLLMALLKKFKGFKEQGITTEKSVCDVLCSLPSRVISARRTTQDKALNFFCTRLYAARGAANNLKRVFHIFDFDTIVQVMRSLRNTLGDQPAADEHEWGEPGKNTMWTCTRGNLMRWSQQTNMVDLQTRYPAEYDAMMRVVQMPDNPAAVVHFNGLQASNYEPPVYSGRPAKEAPGARKRPHAQIMGDQQGAARGRRRGEPDEEGGVEESKESDSDQSNSNDSDDDDSTSGDGEGEGNGVDL
jgi:hypothetical protein